MSWKEIYNSRLMSAEEAVKKVPSNSRVVVGHAVGEPAYLLSVMAEHKEWYENVKYSIWFHLVKMNIVMKVWKNTSVIILYL